MARGVPIAALVGVLLLALAACGGAVSQAGQGAPAAETIPTSPDTAASRASTPVPPTPTQPPSTQPTVAPPVPPPGAGTGTGPTGAESARCSAADLRGELRGGNPAAGNRYATLAATNRAPWPCTLFGYSGLQLVAADGAVLPTEVAWVLNPGPQPVSLAPGEWAGADLRWGVVPGAGEPGSGQCQPVPALIKVIPPDGTRQFDVVWPFGPVCQHGALDLGAYYHL